MPVLKKYGGIKACEDFVQRVELTNSYAQASTKSWKDIDNRVNTGMCNHYATATVNAKYLSCDSIKASTDDYDPDDYIGTSTGTCNFTKNVGTSGVSYQIEFIANANTTIKCFKFFKILKCWISGGTENRNSLMFAIYLDEPISVTSGQSITFSVNFTYDDVTAIVL